MNILDKLQMQTKLGGVLLFREGLFLKAYNQSVYILNELLSQNLKTKYHCIKCLKGQEVIECAFQWIKLAERLPKAVQTDFGAWLSGDYDLSGYQDWYMRRCHEGHVMTGMAKTRSEPMQAVNQAVPTHVVEMADNLSSILLRLTHQQLAYLQNWQRNYYPSEADQGFIESLKRQITPLN